jgi:hypothetical protein
VVGSVTPGTTGHGNRYLAQVLGNAAAAGHTGTFPEKRHQRIAAPPRRPAAPRLHQLFSKPRSCRARAS